MFIYSFLWLILFICPDPLLYAASPDSTLVFYKDMTFNSFLDRAISYQQKADSLYELSIEWRKEAMKMDDPALRDALQKKIIQAEDSTDIYREMARVHFAYLNTSLPREKQHSPYLIKDTVLNGIAVYQYNLTEEFLVKLDEIAESRPSGEESHVQPTGAGTNFRIFKQSPYGSSQSFEYDFPLPAEVFYRIQLAVYKNRLAPDHFRGLSPITTEKIPNKDLTRYFVGKFYHLDDAKNALLKVRAYGFTDAFIIGYYNGTKGTFNKLQELERQP